MNLYHYTVEEHWQSILRSGVIKRASTRQELITQLLELGETSHAERLATMKDWQVFLWLSSNEQWENTVSQSGMGLDTMHYIFGAIRIKLNQKSHDIVIQPWTTYKKNYPHSAKVMEEYNKLLGGNPCEWYYSEDEIKLTLNNILSVERYNGTEWQMIRS